MRLEDHPLYSSIMAISGDVLAAEKATDAVLGSIGQLLVTMADSRKATDTPAHLAQPAFTKISETLARFVDGREALLATHVAVGAAAARMGVDQDSYGPSWPCPSAKRDRAIARRVASPVEAG